MLIASAPSCDPAGRRRLLGAIVAAPVALPALVSAAAAEDAFAAGALFEPDAYADSLSRYHAHLDAWADSLDAASRAGADPRVVAARLAAEREDLVRRGIAAPGPALPLVSPCPFLDDVGGGP